jgi:hypothetical protein
MRFDIYVRTGGVACDVVNEGRRLRKCALRCARSMPVQEE